MYQRQINLDYLRRGDGAEENTERAQDRSVGVVNKPSSPLRYGRNPTVWEGVPPVERGQKTTVGGVTDTHTRGSWVGMESCYPTSTNTQNQYTMVSREMAGLVWRDDINP